MIRNIRVILPVTTAMALLSACYSIDVMNPRSYQGASTAQSNQPFYSPINPTNTNPPTNPPNPTPSPISGGGNNSMQITVNGALCSSSSYANKPCVAVTICAPGTSNCQTINDILLDTGSYGLRVFKSVLTVPLTLTTNPPGGTIAQCVGFGDGASDWGPVESATLQLGSEAPITVPIQVIDSTFSNSAKYCPGADVSPATTGFNGILGVGLFAQDCGPICASSMQNGVYFSCTGSTCSGTTVALANQITNPIAALSQDNNGVLLQFPAVPLGGVASVTGLMTFGVGTQTDNQPTGATMFPANAQTARFMTTFSGQSLEAFIDSGSNGLFFSPPSGTTLPDCGTTDPNFAGFYCPTQTQTLTATQQGYLGTPSKNVSFQIGNFINLAQTPNSVFAEMGANGGQMFDWGLPFYFGRSVYLGIENTSSPLGTGPYWAY